MFTRLHKILAHTPTPMAGLALAIGSLGWSWENAAPLMGYGQWISAGIAAILLCMIASKFFFHRHLLRQDLSHPVVGSVVPTFTMGAMVVSKALHSALPFAADALWLGAVALHVMFLISFIYHRCQDFELHHMVPSWFVPPVGIIVADVCYAGNPVLLPVAQATLIFGMLAYAIMLPLMIHRLIFTHEIPDAAKPTLAILAAPASLSLAGYLTVVQHPSPVIVALLFGIAILMTAIIYLAFWRLLRLPFSPAYAAFTFPMVIGATALFKTANYMAQSGIPARYVAQIEFLAKLELLVATLVVGYVACRYFYHILWVHLVRHPQHAAA